jgi:hypothetical protein
MESDIQYLFPLQAPFKHNYLPTAHLANGEWSWLSFSFLVYTQIGGAKLICSENCFIVLPTLLSGSSGSRRQLGTTRGNPCQLVFVINDGCALETYSPQFVRCIRRVAASVAGIFDNVNEERVLWGPIVFWLPASSWVVVQKRRFLEQKHFASEFCNASSQITTYGTSSVIGTYSSTFLHFLRNFWNSQVL